MDPKRFYGGVKATITTIPEESEDDELSEEEDNINRESHCESEDHIGNNVQNVVLPESDLEDTDDDEDDIPLSELQKRYRSDDPIWKVGNLPFSEDDIKFMGSISLPPAITDLESPAQFFNFFLTKEILNDIVFQSTLYSIQICPNKPFTLTVEELEQFIGTCLYMSVVRLPSTRMYWDTTTNHHLVSDVMSCNQWENIKRFLHFNDNHEQVAAGQLGHDKLFKIRPLLTKVREQLLKVPKEEFLAVDEQIIPTKARSTLKQYNPKKPHKWGYKAFVLSGISGFSYDYEIYAGVQNNTVLIGYPDLGVSSNVVLRLTQTVPRLLNHKIFFDNWFTSIRLLTYLTKQGLLPLGTIRMNRVKNLKAPKEAELKKKDVAL